MSRLAPSLAILIAASAGLPAMAADFGDESSGMDFRSGYATYEPKDWTSLGDDTDSISIETGLRYWYSMGTQSVAGLGSDSTGHTGEAFLRIDDGSTSTYAQGHVGYSFATSTEYGTDQSTDGKLGYAGADFGWSPLNDGQGNSFGGLIGYQYWLDTPGTSYRSNGTITSFDDETGQYTLGGSEVSDSVEIHALRLGLQGKANFNNFMDFRAEIAAVPYAKINGSVSGQQVGFSTTPYSDPAEAPYSGANGNISSLSTASIDNLDTWGYGAMGEAFVGFHPTENIVFRLGGRAWYVQGTADVTRTTYTINQPEDTDADDIFDVAPEALEPQVVHDKDTPFSFLRYGLLAELTYSF
jgi:hypothetical protein